MSNKVNMFKSISVLFLYLLIVSNCSGFSRFKRNELKQTESNVIDDIFKDETQGKTFKAVKEWSKDKKNNLKEILNLFSSYENITLIGWQNVWNADGSLKEVKTIEFTITGDIGNLDIASVLINDDFNDYFWDRLPYTLEILNTFRTKYGIDINVGYELYNLKKKLTFAFYYDSEDVYIKAEDNPWRLQRNITVKSFKDVNKLKDNFNSDLAINTLIYDKSNQLDEDDSIIGRQLLTYCNSQTNVTDKMITSAAVLLANGILTNEEKVLHYIQEGMTVKYPGYIWTVFHESDYEYLVRDVIIQVEYFSLLNPNYEVVIYGKSK